MRTDRQGSLISQNTLRRLIIYGGITLVLGCAQAAFFPLLDICPRTPDLIIGLLLAIALLDGEAPASVCAVAAGFFVDAVGGGALALSPLIYFIYVMVISVFTKKVLKSFASFLLLMLPTLLYRGAATYICTAVAYRELPELWMLTEVLVPEALATALLCLPIYFIVKLFSGMLVNHSRFSF